MNPALRLACLTLAGLLAGCGASSIDHGEASLQGSHPFPTREATAGAATHAIHGVDVAKFQGEIDWSQLRQSGVRFAFIKATEGADRLDDRFAANWQAARAAGVARGAYHFNYWCSPIEDQIAWYQRHVPKDKDSLPPILDLEWNRHSPTCPQRFPKEVVLPRIKKWLVAMERHYGKRPIIYVDAPFYRDILADGELAEYPMWLSNMRGLPQEKFPGRRWAFWQYTYRGQVPGVRGRVDRNVFAGTPGQWDKLAATGFAGDGATTATAGEVTLAAAGKSAPAPAPSPAALPVVAAAENPTEAANLPATAPLPPERPGSVLAFAEKRDEGAAAAEPPPAENPAAPPSLWERLFGR